MAELTDQDRRDIWGEWMRINTDPTPFVKAELRAAVDLTDAWIEANQSGWLTSLDAVSVGDATFAEATDTWTLTAHGLAVDDIVRFTVVGTGADGYVVDVNYYVVAADANTFQLSTGKGGPVQTSTADSVGTWTIEDRKGADFKAGSNAVQKAFLFSEVVRKRYDVGA